MLETGVACVEPVESLPTAASSRTEVRANSRSLYRPVDPISPPSEDHLRMRMGFWWRRRSTALRVLKRYYEPVINRRLDIGEIAARVQPARYPAAPVGPAVSAANQAA